MLLLYRQNIPDVKATGKNMRNRIPKGTGIDRPRSSLLAGPSQPLLRKGTVLFADYAFSDAASASFSFFWYCDWMSSKAVMAAMDPWATATVICFIPPVMSPAA